MYAARPRRRLHAEMTADPRSNMRPMAAFFIRQSGHALAGCIKLMKACWV
jgi:hypothetical protein